MHVPIDLDTPGQQSPAGSDVPGIEPPGGVSGEIAVAMAKGVRESAGTDYAVSVTGVASPGPGSRNMPIGTFFIGLSLKDEINQAIEVRLDGDRNAIKRAVAQETLDRFRLLSRYILCSCRHAKP